MTWRLLLLALLFVVFTFIFAHAQAPPQPLEQIDLVNGRILEGLVLEETPLMVKMRLVSRKSGRPTLTSTEEFHREEIRIVRHLPVSDREELARKLKDLDQQRELFLASLRQLDALPKGVLPTRGIEGIRPTPVAWEDDPNQTAWAFESPYFSLATNLREPLAVLVSLQLEEVFRAISNLFPPRLPGKPTRIRIWADQAGYIKAVSRGQASFDHPAVFDSLTNRIFAGTELARLEGESTELRRHHAKQLGILNLREIEIQKAMGGRVPTDFAEMAVRARRELRDADQKNDQAIRQSRKQLLQILNHESIHAYLGNWVYDQKQQPLPRWLNEGLAQVYETSVIEAGELRADWPDSIRLAGVRQLIREGRFPSLGRILADSPDHFLVRLAGGPGNSNRESSREAYLASWILTYHLTFGKKLLPGQKVDQYLEALAKNEGNEASIAAFENWTGMDLKAFEKAMLDYVGRLRPDGSLALVK